MRLILSQSLTNEAVKTRVDKPMGTRSHEVITEDGVNIDETVVTWGKEGSL